MSRETATETDIVIVGAGAAGSVLAESLTRSGRLEVLLVEAGGKPSSPFVKIPAGFAKLFRSKLDWAFQSAPQASANGRSIFVPRGRMLGGSANINAQIHQWGGPQDFTDWEQAGATGWGWGDVAPVFRSQERFADAAALRGAEGPQHVVTNPHAHPLSKGFVAAARAAGLGDRTDYNGGDPEGAYISQITHHDGQRFSAFDAWLAPAMKRPNLRILTGAEVDQILFERGRATGVRVSIDGRMHDIRAAAGVVLSAGAIGSPHILMRSGVGEGEHLRANGVTVRLDSPGVGANLQEHPMAILGFTTARRDTFKAAESPGNLLRYLTSRKGPLASNAAEAVAFARTHPGLAAPDIELIFAPLHWNDQALQPPAWHGFTIGAAVLGARSRGRISLQGPGRDRPPVIDFGLFTDPDGADRKVLLAAMRLARRVALTAPLTADVTGEPDPHPWDAGDDALFDSACRTLQTVYHPAGTCRMGTDAGSVTTPRTAVRGLDRLWVADASTMPTLVRGHPTATVTMLAERAAGFIAADLAAPQRAAVSGPVMETV